jgi:putative oxidoreductase
MKSSREKAFFLRLGFTGARIGLGLLFAWAAVGKLADSVAFADDMANYRVLPASWVAPMTATIPGIELTVAALLIVGLYTRAAATITAGMLLVFTVAIGQALGRGVNLSCGCFGGAPEPASSWTVLRDVALLFWAVAIAVFSPEPSVVGVDTPISKA